MIPQNKQSGIKVLSHQKSLNKKQLKSIRILQKNSIHLIGLPIEIAEPEILKQKKFFGQYGKIKRLSVRQVFPDIQNLKKGFLSVYVTFSSSNEASIAILCLNGFFIDKRQLKVSYGLTRYCSKFLEGLLCLNEECDYKHELVDSIECCDSQNPKHNNKIKSLKNSDIFQYLISHNFNFYKFFKKYNDVENIKEDYFLPQKQIIWKKYQKYINKLQQKHNNQSFIEQNIQDINPKFQEQLSVNFVKNKQNLEQGFNLKQKYYSPQSSIKSNKKYKRLKSWQLSETNQEIQYNHYLYLSKYNQCFEEKDDTLVENNSNKQEQKKGSKVQKEIDQIKNQSNTNILLNYKIFDPSKYCGIAPEIENKIFQYKDSENSTFYQNNFVFQIIINYNYLITLNRKRNYIIKNFICQL